jgi:hypothetical protein
MDAVKKAIERASSVAGLLDKNSTLFDPAEDEKMDGLIIKEVTKPQLTG